MKEQKAITQEEALDAYITKLVGKNSALYQTIIGIVKAGGIDA
nr:MAG TPA: hypothetical protein [Bacteriophage sp.]